MMLQKDNDPEKPDLPNLVSFKALRTLKNKISEASLNDDVEYPLTIPNFVERSKNAGNPELEHLLAYSKNIIENSKAI